MGVVAVALLEVHLHVRVVRVDPVMVVVHQLDLPLLLIPILAAVAPQLKNLLQLIPVIPPLEQQEDVLWAVL